VSGILVFNPQILKPEIMHCG